MVLTITPRVRRFGPSNPKVGVFVSRDAQAASDKQRGFLPEQEPVVRNGQIQDLRGFQAGVHGSILRKHTSRASKTQS